MYVYTSVYNSNYEILNEIKTMNVNERKIKKTATLVFFESCILLLNFSNLLHCVHMKQLKAVLFIAVALTLSAQWDVVDLGSQRFLEPK